MQPPDTGSRGADTLIAVIDRHVRRLVGILRAPLGVVLVPIVLVWVVERLLAWLWLGQTPARVFSDAWVVLPGLALMGLALTSVTAMLLRVLLLVVIFVTSYVQYAFHVYFGRFLGEDEFRLAVGNPKRELWASLDLYFSKYALLAAVFVTALYLLLAFRKPRVPGGHRLSVVLLSALLGWCLMLEVASPARAVYSPVLAFAATSVRLGVHWSHSLLETRPRRHPAPMPTGVVPDYDVIYLVGESLRADRFRGASYGRNTIPRLRGLQLPKIEFANVTSGGDCTDRSMPLLMVGPARPFNTDIYRRPTLFAYAKKAGYRTAFVNANENDWPEFVDDNIDILSRNIEAFGGTDRWRFANDNEMLPVIAEIANAPGRQFLVVETYAAHWPYDDRYVSCPECRVYLPDLRGKAASFSPKFQKLIVNSYDNALVYFDQFATRLIGALRKPTLIVLTSDHGESLGENGLWGHCSASIEQMLVPLMFLATDERVARAAGFPELEAKTDLPLSHANIFPSLLGVLGYDSTALEFSYAPSVWRLPSSEEGARPVLVSPIGDGTQQEAFVGVDARRHPSSRETMPAGH